MGLGSEEQCQAPHPATNSATVGSAAPRVLHAATPSHGARETAEEDDDLDDIMGLGSEEQCQDPHSATANNPANVASAAPPVPHAAMPSHGPRETGEEDDDDLDDIMGLGSKDECEASTPAIAPHISSGSNGGPPTSSGQHPPTAAAAAAAAAEAFEARNHNHDEYDDDLGDIVGLGSPEDCGRPPAATPVAGALSSAVPASSDLQQLAPGSTEAEDREDGDTSMQ